VDDSVFEATCPCCGATLEIDAERRVVLSHVAPKLDHIPVDLREAVLDLKSREGTREKRFRKQFQAEKKHGEDLQKRFDGLLKKARSEGPPERPQRDIDLD
jgi:hypothetical protein